MAQKLTKGGRVFFTLLAIGSIVAVYFFVLKPTVLAPKAKESKVISKVDLPTAPENAEATIGQLVMPSDKPAKFKKPQWKLWEMAWNSQMGINFANGGPVTTEGSIMQKYGISLSIERQDDYSNMKAQLMDFAEDYKSNPNGPWRGIQFMSIMGDAGPFVLESLNKNLEKLGAEYRAEIIGSPGKSLGEDKVMLPQTVVDNPKDSLKGIVIAAVILDGDWNIAVQYAAANGVAINPDVTTYDPEAVNFYSVSSFVEAGNAYINGVTEKRPVVKNGKITGEKRLISVRGTAIWTPVDVNVVEQKGGLVTAASTKDYSSQMANTIIGIRKFNMDHKEEVKNFIRAFCEGGDMVKAYSEALKKAGEISAKIYGQENGAYWVKFYKGAVATDIMTGENIHCGGSALFNLADNFNYYGIAEGQQNIYRTIYNIFGSIDTTYHPEQIATFPRYEKVVNTTYMKEIYEEISSGNLPIAQASTQDFSMNTDVKIVSNRSVSINFELGSSKFKPDAIKVLENIYAQSINASSLYITIVGHTDATGTQSQNEILADERALAVKEWLQKKDPVNFPDSRFTRVEGYADNSTRRVDIGMGRAQ